MTLRDDLRPAGRGRVMDLVQAAGIDVSDWVNFTGGRAKAATNPKYCYEWAFIDRTAGVVVLNLWHHNIAKTRGGVTVTTNLRKTGEEIRAQGGNATRARRAASFDAAIRTAVELKMIVRAILNEGRRDAGDDRVAKTDSVKLRALDPLPWHVMSYDVQTGNTVLGRGAAIFETSDQFDVGPLPDNPAERIPVSGFAYARDPQVRKAVLLRANGRCEYCSVPGFVMRNGSHFLETHHIVPLSEDGADRITNVAAVCANHHREAHHGAGASAIREHLLNVAAGAARSRPSR